MPPKISITLPSLYPEACARALENIAATTQCNYEVIVVSPFDPGFGSHIRWIMDGPEKRGAAVAQDRAARAAQGEFVAAFSDDFLFVDRWDAALIPDYVRREQAPENIAVPYVMGMRHDTIVGTHFGIYYPNFPLMRQTLVSRIGWISPDYRGGFGDGDLGLRTWAAGGRCEWSESIVLRATPDEARKGTRRYAEGDFEKFVERWGPKFGRGWKHDHLADFCHNICPEESPEIIDSTGRSTFYNDPAFAKKTHPMPRLLETIGAFNIIYYAGRYLVVPHRLGPIDLSKLELSTVPGIIAEDSVDNARRAALRY